MHEYALAWRQERRTARRSRGHRARARPVHVPRERVVLDGDGEVDAREGPNLPADVRFARAGSVMFERSHGPALRFDGPADEEDLVGADTARAPIVCVGELAPAIEVLFDVLFDEDLGADLG